MDELDRIRADITYLNGLLSPRDGKYIRNLNRYLNNGSRRENIWDPNVLPMGYVLPAREADGIQTQLNLGKSCVDTVTSKISQANVRPFFNPDDGSFSTTKVCRNSQKFADSWLDEQHAYPKSIACFRDAAIFDIGVLHINAETQSINRIAPWEYFLDPAEYYHGCVSRTMILKRHYPLTSFIGNTNNQTLKIMYKLDRSRKGEYVTYYDLVDGFKYEFFDHELINEPTKINYEKYGGLYRRPFVEIYFNKPLKSFYSTSLIDDLYPLQKQVDELMARLDNATRNAVINMVLVPKNSGMKATMLQNGVGVYDWTPSPDGGQPVFMTPPALNQQWILLIDKTVEWAYQQAGITQLSAQGKKPVDVESGKAMQTMEDIESDRFNVQLQQFTHFLVDVMRVSMDCFTGDILPNQRGTAKTTWKQVREQRKLFNITFSAASSLSKDPSKKIEEVDRLLSMGYVDTEIGAQLLEMPDLHGLYTLATSSIDYVQKIIDDAVEKDDYDFEETVDVQLLLKHCFMGINRYASAGDDKAVASIKNLIKQVYKLKKNIDFVTAPPMPIPPETPPQAPGLPPPAPQAQIEAPKPPSNPQELLSAIAPQNLQPNPVPPANPVGQIA